jgi:hypothetical protein
VAPAPTEAAPDAPIPDVPLPRPRPKVQVGPINITPPRP